MPARIRRRSSFVRKGGLLGAVAAVDVADLIARLYLDPFSASLEHVDRSSLFQHAQNLVTGTRTGAQVDIAGGLSGSALLNIAGVDVAGFVAGFAVAAGVGVGF